MTLQQTIAKPSPPSDVGSLGDWLKALGILAAIAALVVWVGWRSPAPSAAPAPLAASAQAPAPAAAPAPAPSASAAPPTASAPPTDGPRFYALTRADARGPYAAIVDPVPTRAARNACRSALAAAAHNRSLLAPKRVRTLRVGTCFELPDACAPSPAWHAGKGACS